ncbi:hypothetical protein Nepgr_006746 [Nepenthes gracilis]|uniref:Uncharacterized protein n=1 Tax=Nepenthes gracilis TaxID=150966 RepID=A0AAD3XHW3_NEPGR|nr:hypothetical protein Nepgr_006746 [Nepenthes gracilis]
MVWHTLPNEAVVSMYRSVRRFGNYADDAGLWPLTDLLLLGFARCGVTADFGIDDVPRSLALYKKARCFGYLSIEA